jgi:hypothetical protein
MNRPEQQLEVLRMARDAARGAFDARFEQVRSDLEARGVGGRIVDKLGEDARDALGQALDVARESKGVVAGTVAALALWLLRHPIVAWADGLLERDTEKDEIDE